jgi:hypothetical protein
MVIAPRSASTGSAASRTVEEPAMTDTEMAPEIDGAAPGKPLSEPARRALLEAAARRAEAARLRLPHEDGGPAGPEPTRYGDWERKGVAIDF